MRHVRIFLIFSFLAPLCFAQSRWDFSATTTGNPVSGSTSPSTPLAPVLAIANAKVQLCTVTVPSCQVLLTTYTDSTVGTACPTNAQLTRPGVSGCFSTADSQGNFGAWVIAGTAFQYVITSSYGAAGPFDVTPGGGGAGNPAGTTFQAQYNGGAIFAASKATFDAAGNFNDLSTNSIDDAFLNQTTPTSNNGIVNELTAGGKVATASGTYPNVEWPGGAVANASPYWRNPYGTGGIEQAPPAIGENSLLVDNRINSYGTVFYDPPPNWPNIYNMTLMDDGPAINGSSGQWSFNQDFQIIHCCGFNDENFDTDQTVFTGFHQFLASQASGITSGFAVDTVKPGNGDNQIAEFSGVFSDACIIPSDECNESIRIQHTQSTFPAVFDLETTMSRGDTFWPLTNISGWLPGEGAFAVIPTQAGSVLHATAITNPYIGGNSNPGTITVLETLTPDVFGFTTQSINTPAAIKGGTTNATLNLTGITGSGFVNNSTFPTVCVSNSKYTEEAAIVGSVPALSGGAQTFTVALRHSYNLASTTITVTQGVNACKGLEAMANKIYGYNTTSSFQCPTTPIGNAPCPVRQMAKVIGVPSAHVIQYAIWIASGGWDSIQFGSVYPSGNVPAPLLTRSSNTVTLNTVGDNFRSANQNKILVSGCPDTSYNGTFGPITQTSTTLTWINTGSNGNTSGCNPIAFIASNNGLPANAFQMMPAPVIVEAQNPTTKAQTGFVVEANNYLVTTGDSTESQPGGEVGLVNRANLLGLQTPPSGSDPFVDYANVMVGTIPDGFALFQYGFGNWPSSWLIGGGGTRNPAGTIIHISSDPGVLNFWIKDDGGPDSNAQLMAISGCGAYICEDPVYEGAALWNWTMDSSLGSYIQRVVPSQGMQSIFGGGSASDGFTLIQQSSTNVQIENNAPAGGQNSVWSVGSGVYDLQQGGLVSGTSFFEESKCILTSCFDQITNQATGAQVTATLSLTNYTITGGSTPVPTLMDVGSSVAGQAIPVVGSPTVGQAACIKNAGPPVVIGFCGAITAGTGVCVCN